MVDWTGRMNGCFQKSEGEREQKGKMAIALDSSDTDVMNNGGEAH